MRSSFRYLIALSCLFTIYMILLSLHDTDKPWTSSFWPHFSHAGRPQSILVESGIPSSSTNLPLSGYLPGKAPTVATSVRLPDSSDEPSTLTISMSTTSITPTENVDGMPTETISVQPSSTPPSKVIVMAKLEDEDTSWVEDSLPEWQRAIYTVDNTSATLHTSQNKGREANVYLTYVIENFDNLTDIIVFLHSHRNGYPKAWHTDAADYDNVNSINSLRLDTVLDHGYVNLRCNPAVGCPDEIQPFRDPPEAHRTAELLYPEAWKYMMGPELEIPQVVGVACCSQFAVSRKQVLTRPKANYERYLKWLLETDANDGDSGRVLEYMWHIIYGKSPVFCPSSSSCYCDVYGRC